MQKYYKYTMKAYAEDMLKYGRVRVGTLFEYRHYDDNEIKDIDEGKGEQHRHDKDKVIYRRAEHVPLHVKKAFGIPMNATGDISLVMENNHYLTPQGVPNAHIYCVTKVASKEVMRKFKCDACIEITDIQLFSTMVGLKLFSKGLLNGLPSKRRDCMYKGRRFMYSEHDRLEIFWMKDERFSHQCEHRIVYPTKISNGNLQPIIMDVPELKTAIKLHQF